MRKLLYIPFLPTMENEPYFRKIDEFIPGLSENINNASNRLQNSIDREIDHYQDKILGTKVFGEGMTPNNFWPLQATHPFDLARKLANGQAKALRKTDPDFILKKTLWLAGAEMISIDSESHIRSVKEESRDMDAWAQGDFSPENMELQNKRLEELYTRMMRTTSDRDIYAAAIIDSMLKKDDSGILIATIARNLTGMLPTNITITYISDESRELTELLVGQIGEEGYFQGLRQFAAKEEGHHPSKERY